MATTNVILEEAYDPNYEWKEEEVIEYAQFLGFDVENDADLLWIAKEGLKSPMPSDWKACRAPDGGVYYFNFANGTSQWNHPLDDECKRKYEEAKKKKAIAIMAEDQKEEEEAEVVTNSHSSSTSEGGEFNHPAEVRNVIPKQKQPYKNGKESALKTVEASSNSTKFEMKDDGAMMLQSRLEELKNENEALKSALKRNEKLQLEKEKQMKVLIKDAKKRILQLENQFKELESRLAQLQVMHSNATTKAKQRTQEKKQHFVIPSPPPQALSSFTTTRNKFAKGHVSQPIV